MQRVTAVIALKGKLPSHWRSMVSAYMNLVKPHVTVLLLGTTLAAMVVAAGELPSVGLVLATLLGGAMAAGGANAINCYYDRDIDQIMSRTRNRTLPAQRLKHSHALIFGLGLGVASAIIFLRFVNALSAFLSVSALLFYVIVYTMWLKRTTPQNIVIGGAAGAVPVLVGWAAVANTISLTSLWMFVIIFLWTPPHFWALSLLLKKDYARAHIPMLPVVAGENATYRQIILYTLLLVAASLILFGIHAMGYLYLVAAIGLGAGLLALAILLACRRSQKQARVMFWFSNYYLALIFAVMVIDRTLR
ncbi:MAG: protoheme IX farnesyltransferase [Chloroflexi bacterium]|nr:MAG: protoheme IX farnesyltransferase [Chloroflexota bacterium]